MRTALAWSGITVIATVLAVAHVYAIGRPELMWHAVFGNDIFVLLWALATPLIFSATARFPIRKPADAVPYAIAFGIFFIGTNAAFDISKLVAALTLNAVPAALAFTVLVAIGHRLAMPRSLTHVAIADRGRTHRVPVDAIRWIEAEDNYVLIHTPERTYTARERISDFESKLDASRFARVSEPRPRRRMRLRR
jgi:DNA-binding LytR/AlgR family response regulator